MAKFTKINLIQTCSPISVMTMPFFYFFNPETVASSLMFLLLSRLTSNQSANPFHHTPNIMRIWHFAPSPPLASWSKPPSPLAWTTFNSLLPGPLASASVSLPSKFPSFLSQHSSQSDLVKNCQMRPFLCWMGHLPRCPISLRVQVQVLVLIYKDLYNLSPPWPHLPPRFPLLTLPSSLI